MLQFIIPGAAVRGGRDGALLLRKIGLAQSRIEAELPAAWRETTSFSDWVLRLTPARAAELRDRIHALVEETPEDDGEGAEHVVFQSHAFPLPGRIAAGHDVEGVAR